MITNLLNKNIVKIISFLSISPGSRYTRKEIREKTKMNNVPLDETITKLSLMQIIKQEKKMYSLKLESERAKKVIEMIKTEYDKYNLSYNIFIILLEITEKLSKFKNIKDIILFGSYAKLIHTDRSDIDVAIIVNSKQKEKLKNKIANILKEISNKENKIIEIHFFTIQEMKENKTDPLIRDIIKNGKS